MMIQPHIIAMVAYMINVESCQWSDTYPSVTLFPAIINCVRIATIFRSVCIVLGQHANLHHSFIIIFVISFIIILILIIIFVIFIIISTIIFVTNTNL